MIAFLHQLLAVILSVAIAAPVCSCSKSVGNRTQKTSTLPGGPSNYNANDQLSTDTYHPDGNSTASNGNGYAYDFENHLIQQGGVSIVYDGDGNRASKTVNGITTTYLVDTQNPTGYAQVLLESFGGRSGTAYEITHTYVYGLERISERRSFLQNNQGNTANVYYVYDGHGSVRALTDQSGTVTDTYDYDAFGVLIHQTGTTPNNYLFAAEQFDPDLGLYFNRARYLNTSTGRFWSMDEFEGSESDPKSIHKYVYSGNNAVNNSDPSGRDTLADVNFTGALIVALSATITLAAVNICAQTIRTLGREGPCRLPNEEDTNRRFYKGTTVWEADPFTALEVDISGLGNRLETAPWSKSYDFGPGFYMTESYSTAYSFAKFYGGTLESPIKGGPAILDIKIKNDKWDLLKSEGAKDTEPISGLPGQYQAFVPLNLFEQFVLYATFASYPVN